MRALILAIALLVCSLALGGPTTVHPLAEATVNSAKGKFTGPAPLKQETAEKLLVVNARAEAKSKERVALDKIETERRADAEARLVFWTVVLAIATIALAAVALGQLWMFVRQLGYMRDDIQRARAEFNAAHFPRLEVRRLQLRHTDIQRGINFVVANVGEAGARDIRGDLNLAIMPTLLAAELERESLPPYAGHYVDISEEINRPVLNARERAFIFVSRPDLVTDEAMDRIEGGQATLFFFGYVDFLDSNNVRRDTGFFRKYNPKTKRFEAKDDPDYEWS